MSVYFLSCHFHAFMHWLIHSFARSFIQSFVPSFLHSFIPSFVRSFTTSFSGANQIENNLSSFYIRPFLWVWFQLIIEIKLTCILNPREKFQRHQAAWHVLHWSLDDHVNVTRCHRIHLCWRNSSGAWLCNSDVNFPKAFWHPRNKHLKPKWKNRYLFNGIDVYYIVFDKEINTKIAGHRPPWS